MKISIYNRNEYYSIDTELITYLKAEDHFTYVHNINGNAFLVPIGLSNLCNMLAENIDFDSVFIKVSRSYVISRKYISHINIAKETVTFNYILNRPVSLALPKTKLKTLINELKRLDNIKYDANESM